MYKEGEKDKKILQEKMMYNKGRRSERLGLGRRRNSDCISKREEEVNEEGKGKTKEYKM